MENDTTTIFFSDLIFNNGFKKFSCEIILMIKKIKFPKFFLNQYMYIHINARFFCTTMKQQNLKEKAREKNGREKK